LTLQAAHPAGHTLRRQFGEVGGFEWPWRSGVGEVGAVAPRTCSGAGGEQGTGNRKGAALDCPDRGRLA
jgi:hypothetical protein